MTQNNNEKSIVLAANRELAAQTADPAAMRALIATVFKGFKDEKTVKQACLEAMMRGYSFQDIVNKKIYAIPFGGGYSLVQAIADVRAIAMKSGQVGKSAPEYEEKDNKIVSCTVTVKRRVDGYVGDYTATVYFDEYFKKGMVGKPSQWELKPRTMIAKVAEMHALRMAFPEFLAQSYVEEEFDKDAEQENARASRIETAKEEGEKLKMGAIQKKTDDGTVTDTIVEETVDDGIPIVGEDNL